MMPIVERLTRRRAGSGFRRICPQYVHAEQRVQWWHHTGRSYLEADDRVVLAGYVGAHRAVELPEEGVVVGLCCHSPRQILRLAGRGSVPDLRSQLPELPLSRGQLGIRRGRRAEEIRVQLVALSIEIGDELRRVPRVRAFGERIVEPGRGLPGSARSTAHPRRRSRRSPPRSPRRRAAQTYSAGELAFAHALPVVAPLGPLPLPTWRVRSRSSTSASSRPAVAAHWDCSAASWSAAPRICWIAVPT